MANQNILLVDVGNTSAKWSLYNRVNENALAAMSQQQYTEDIDTSFFVNCWNGLDKPGQVVVSSVANRDVWWALQQACAQLWSIKAEKVVSLAEGFGVRNAYLRADELGSDRWCVMIAAFHETDAGVIVVDCGSAMTIDVMTSSGKHLGGYILPGLAMMKHSLGTQTAEVKISKSVTKPSLTPSSSTSTCVESASYLATVKLIEAVFEQQRGQAENIQCFLTGGDASLVSGLLSIKHILLPDLVLRGLAIIAGSGLESK